MGAAFGAKEALKVMGAHLALAIGATALLGWHPVGLAALMLGGAAGRAIWKRGAINRNIIESVANTAKPNYEQPLATTRSKSPPRSMSGWATSKLGLETDLHHSITEVQEMRVAVGQPDCCASVLYSAWTSKAWPADL